MSDKILCPSMMCVDYDCLKEEVKRLDEAGIDIFHCDIMDGNFVPNITMGTLDIKTVRKNTDKMIDAHLMIENPGNKIDIFIEAGADLIYIHPESERYTIKTLLNIKDKGKLAGLAINPDTSVDSIYEMLAVTDYILVMTVNPGFAGQKFLEFTIEKIKKLVALKERFNYKIIIDGGLTPERIKQLSQLGADGFILGTSCLFGFDNSWKDIITELRGL